MQALTLDLEQLRTLVNDCLLANGADAQNARCVTEVIISAERDGCDSHGLFRLPGYVRSLRNGKVNGAARPHHQTNSPGVLRVDGDGGYSPTALIYSVSLLPDLVHAQGVVSLALINSFHFGAVWFELERIAMLGFAALAFLPSAAAVAPHGSRQAFFGTDPMGFAWPRSGRTPLVFDQSTATRARGEIMIAARDGAPVPPGLGLDRAGDPTTDADAILNGGVQLPFGGHKGSAIGLMIELLGAGLLGQDFGYERQGNDNADGGPTRGGQLLIVVDPRAFGDAAHWADHCEAFFARLQALEGVRLPGQRRHQNRQSATRDGVRVDAALYATVVELTDHVG